MRMATVQCTLVCSMAREVTDFMQLEGGRGTGLAHRPLSWPGCPGKPLGLGKAGGAAPPLKRADDAQV